MSDAKPKVYAFINGGRGNMLFPCALAEDGKVLAGHCSSSPGWARHDMGADGHCTWKHELYAAHYPQGFEVEWVDDPTTHPGCREAIARANAAAPPDTKATTQANRSTNEE